MSIFVMLVKRGGLRDAEHVRQYCLVPAALDVMLILIRLHAF